MDKTILVQFPPTANATIERVQEVEVALDEALSDDGSGVVDGNDFGDCSNVFIFPEGDWEPCLASTMSCLGRLNALDEVVVIKRDEAEEYEVVHPKSFAGDFERC